MLGVRSDDLLPASGGTGLPTVTARIELVEALGSHSIVYLRVDATSLRHKVADPDEVEEEGSGEGVTATRPNLVASFPAREAVGLELEEHIPIAVDVANVHLFDPESGEPLR